MEKEKVAEANRRLAVVALGSGGFGSLADRFYAWNTGWIA